LRRKILPLQLSQVFAVSNRLDALGQPSLYKPSGWKERTREKSQRHLSPTNHGAPQRNRIGARALEKPRKHGLCWKSSCTVFTGGFSTLLKWRDLFGQKVCMSQRSLGSVQKRNAAPEQSHAAGDGNETGTEDRQAAAHNASRRANLVSQYGGPNFRNSLGCENKNPRATSTTPW